MEQYIDIHSHILPGVDDGAENMEMSIGMLHKAAEEGIGAIILTPHYMPMRHNPSPETIKKARQALNQRMAEENIEIKLYMGNEIYYSRDGAEDLQEGKALTLAGTSYVLVEFHPMQDYAYIRDGVKELLSYGYYPVIAHVERYLCLAERKERAGDLVSMGCLLQVNAGSITGVNGSGSRRKVKKLLKEGLVHFVATDSHDDRERPPQMREAAAYVEKKYGAACRERLFCGNAGKLLEGAADCSNFE